MQVHIDYHSDKPICQQAVEQIKFLIVNGQLQPGEQLPSIRQCARELEINPTTVSRIYRQLASEDVITLRQGAGAFVSDRPPKIAPEEVKRIVREHARKLLVEGLRHGLSIDEIREMLNEEYKRIDRGEQ